MSEKILMVDDEANVLDAYRRQLGRTFDIDSALGGAEALAMINAGAQYAVVVSDMKMDGMNGIEFLSQVRIVAPDSVRIMLTGADVQTAVAAVNEGCIFRFLTKPCPNEVLSPALKAALEQYRLVTTERNLLSTTLTGAVRILVEILETIKPVAFGRASRIRPLVRRLAEDLAPDQVWRAEVAAMLSQVGCVAVAEATLTNAYRDELLTGAERRAFELHPRAGRDLVAHVPRLAEVAEVILNQEKHFDGGGFPDTGLAGEKIPLESRIIKAVLDYDTLLATGYEPAAAIRTLYERKGWYDRTVLSALIKAVAADAARETVAVTA